MEYQRSLFKALFILFTGMMILSFIYPWSSDALGILFNPALKNHMTFGAFICAMTFFLAYLKTEEATAIKLIKKGPHLYSKAAIATLEKNNFSVSDIESIINVGSQTERANGIKYSGQIGNTTVLVFTDSNHAITDIIF